jgi:hypothetical protein
MRRVRFPIDDDFKHSQLCKCKPGPREVHFPGPFVPGKPGYSRECSYSIYGQGHSELFGFEVYGVHTTKRRIYVAYKRNKNGILTHCYAYSHNGRATDGNDLRKPSKEDLTRPIHLVPLMPSGRRRPVGDRTVPSRKTSCLRGALRRAVLAKNPAALEIYRLKRLKDKNFVMT